jgi:primase-polymerase (primpol)-like protein
MSESLPTESDLPSTLTTRDQWLCWRAEKRDGKQTKIPVDPTTGEFASTTDSDTWSDFETARDRVTSSSADTDGLGFVFTQDDSIVGVDLDDCRIPETGKTREWATDIIDCLDSFTEISPSGTGYHVLVEGTLPEGRNRKDDIELYETARFFTVTGDHVDGTPTTVETCEESLRTVHQEYVSQTAADEPSQTKTDTATSESAAEPSLTSTSLSDQALLERAKNAANGEKFTRLWRGNTAGYESHSEADMALCSLLAFWTGGDDTQMDRMFRDSGLFRAKWDEQHFADGSTYGEKTIKRAISGTNEFYEPPSDETDKRTTNERDTSKSFEPDTGAKTGEQQLNTNREKDRKHASARLERIEELESELREALDQTERLRTELENERACRRELEAELERVRETAEEKSSGWFPW